MKFRGDTKKGTSAILLILIIIFTIFILTIVISFLNNSKNIRNDTEHVFKSSLTAYIDELELYIANEKDADFKKEEFNVYGSKLRNVIPYIKEEDMAKFEIKQGEILYIGNDSSEKLWFEEVLESEGE